MRYFVCSVILSLGFVWGATTYAGAAGEERGRRAAATELDAGPELLAQADVPTVGPAAAVLSDGPLTPVVEPPAAVATATAAAAPPPRNENPPKVTGESTPEEVADATWWALRAGYLGPALLFAVFYAGVLAQKKRGYIVKRWPWLNDGRAWAAVSIVTTAAITLLPLAGAELSGADGSALTFRSLYTAAFASALLYAKSHLGATPAAA